MGEWIRNFSLWSLSVSQRIELCGPPQQAVAMSNFFHDIAFYFALLCEKLCVTWRLKAINHLRSPFERQINGYFLKYSLFSWVLQHPAQADCVLVV